MLRTKQHFILIMILLSACGTISVEPTPTAIPTQIPSNTPAPTETATFIPTESPQPTQTVSPTATENVSAGLYPEGTPLGDWEGIPIMLQAITGEGDAESYRFSIALSSDEVQKYYDEELAKLGWGIFAVGANDSGTGAKIIFYKKNNELMTMSLIPLDNDLLLVMFVK